MNLKEGCTEAPKNQPTKPNQNTTVHSLALQTLRPEKLFQRNQTKKVTWLFNSPIPLYAFKTSPFQEKKKPKLYQINRLQKNVLLHLSTELSHRPGQMEGVLLLM